MSSRYECPVGDCDKSVVLVAGCGVAHTLLCDDHNREMEYVGSVSTEWVGHESGHNGDCYRIDR